MIEYFAGMPFAICPLSLVPCRREPNHRSEMVSQLLFGELAEILETQPNWLKIRNTYDAYESWVEEKQLLLIDDEQFQMMQKPPFYLSAELVSVAIRQSDRQLIPLLFGSTLPFYMHGFCNMGTEKISLEGQAIDPTTEGSRDKIAETAYMYLNTPYLWGGRSPFGIDCSGFTQMVYKLNGIFLPRDAYQQAEMGDTLSFLEEAQPGDLAFFDNEEGRITHTGIVLENGKIIHASGEVRIDLLDHQGIYHTHKKCYTHNLRLLKHVSS